MNVSSTLHTYSIKYQKEKAIKALAKAKSIEKELIERGKKWIKANNRSWILK